MKYFIGFLIFINSYGFFLMYDDKKKAIRKQWRTPEDKLFSVAICFGSLGILTGMYYFRHKTKHLKFVIGIPLILIVQIAFGFLLSYKNF